ncbi:MAG TPA: SEC-C metal-binding domain-containing protein [Caulifigura sp.]|nr:SEC-C metal-binding domain-containing protein [Caulifigura sp.]
MSKRRKGFPSETQVKRGDRVVHGDKLLEEKLGRNDLCPCGSKKRFKRCCLSRGCFRRGEPSFVFSGSERLRGIVDLIWFSHGSRHFHRSASVGKILLLPGAILPLARADQHGPAQDTLPGATVP